MLKKFFAIICSNKLHKCTDCWHIESVEEKNQYMAHIIRNCCRWPKRARDKGDNESACSPMVIVENAGPY